MAKPKQGQILQLKIEKLEIKQSLIDKKIKDITRHLSGEGYRRRIRPCDVDDPNEKECPWSLE